MARTFIVVRHAKAGDRADWQGDDTQRPLTKGGRRQALALAEQLAAHGVSRVLTSPYLRCRQTVAPLAERLGLPVETSDDLAEGGERDALLDLLASLPSGTVLCSHGDVIGVLLEYLAARRVVLPPLPPTEKGAYWQIEMEDDTFVRARLASAP